MNVPKHVQIGPTRYKVKVDGEFLNTEAVNTGAPRGLFGNTEHHTCVITLHDSNGVERQREVLLHEVLHGVTENTGVAATLGFAKEEDVVSRLAPMLLDVLRSNPKLVDYLLSSE